MYKVRMVPSLNDMKSEESGIKRVVEAYTKYLPQYGFEVVGKRAAEYDLTVSHAGTMVGADVVMTHGLYWTSDYRAAAWEWRVNQDVIDSIRHAKEVTVPSHWVQEVFQRDMRFSPTVIPHGIDSEDWEHNYKNEGYVLWNKNRNADVCSPEPMVILANKFPQLKFVSTFSTKGSPNNIKVTGKVEHSAMKEMVQKAGVYLSTTKETFGIGVLEVMASGVPVLGFAHGGNLDLIQHTVTGYLARPGDYDDLAYGLSYCLRYRRVLGTNAKEVVKDYTWDKACEKLVDVFEHAMYKQEPSVCVVVPAYNKEATLERAVTSALHQTKYLTKVVIVDDGSSDNTKKVGTKLAKLYSDRVIFISQENSGVAVARNNGASNSGDEKYLCFLDGDDRMEPEFLETCVNALEKDQSLHLAYTRLKWVMPDGSTGESKWPDEWNYDLQLQRKNQVPTCNVMRKETFERLGGYKKRYCPTGAGSEDAELWTRFGAYGYKCGLVSRKALFEYSFKSGHTAQSGYSETDWLIYHPFVKDNIHPFASYASPGKRFSHPVRQYDEPIVSVVIPVGKGHEHLVADALDTIEGQSYRSWEVDIGWDSDESYDHILKVYPHVRIVKTNGRGAGAARNAAVNISRGKFLLFLDADDWLYPEAIEKMLTAWEKENHIIYSDYVGKSTITPEYATKLGDRLLSYNEKTGDAVVSFRSMDYDCHKAMREPEDITKPYIWNLVTSLVPRVWHNSIGGFDEKMPSWEDWDYWLRMAHAGKCFTRIEEPLVVYRFYTGRRRMDGHKYGQNLVKYLTDKYKDKEMAPCGCSQNNKKIVVNKSSNQANPLSDEQYVLIKYGSTNRGQHMVVGHITGKRYGYRSGGEVFYVHREDAARMPNLFIPVSQKPTIEEEERVTDTPPPMPLDGVAGDDPLSIFDNEPEEEPEELKPIDVLDLTMLPGVSPSIAKEFEKNGIETREDILELGVKGLSENVSGIGETRAKAIIAYIMSEMNSG